MKFYFKDKIIQIITPFFLAIIIAYLLNPIILKLESKKISRMMGIIIIYTIASLLMFLLIIFMIPELINNIKELMNTVPEITYKYQKIFNNFMSFIKTSNWPPDVKNALYEEIDNGTKSAQLFIMNALKEILMSLIDTIALLLDMILAMILAYYFIKDNEVIKYFLIFISNFWYGIH